MKTGKGLFGYTPGAGAERCGSSGPGRLVAVRKALS